ARVCAAQPADPQDTTHLACRPPVKLLLLVLPSSNSLGCAFVQRTTPQRNQTHAYPTTGPAYTPIHGSSPLKPRKVPQEEHSPPTVQRTNIENIVSCWSPVQPPPT
ncbi:unnamed protein product, partial [Ectocarpus fasciculatus]